MRIKVEPFLMKKGNRLAKAAIEFDSNDGPLAGFHLVGFTICEDAQKGMFVMFPSAERKVEEGEKKSNYYFLRPDNSSEGMLDRLQDAILDVYDSMTVKSSEKKKS